MIAADLGSGRPLVLIHGFVVDHRILLPLDPVVAASGWRRIYLDLPWTPGGHDPDLDSAQAIADAVVAQVRAHLGDEPFAVLGNSFGAMIARHVAHELRGQVLGLGTLAGVFVSEHSERVVAEREVLIEDPAVLECAGADRADFAGVTVLQTPEVLAAFRAAVVPGASATDKRVLARVSADYHLDAAPEVAHPDPFRQPALLMFGRQDDVVGFEDGLSLRDHYPRATIAVLDAAGHNPSLERPALVGALITDWLDRMDRIS